MKKYIIIPARLESARLPNKLLLRKNNSTVLDYAINNALRAVAQDRVVLAYNEGSEDLRKIADLWHIQAIPTSKECWNGTLRVCEAAEKLGLEDNDVVCNLQADCVGIDDTAFSFCLNPSEKIIHTCFKYQRVLAYNLNEVKLVTDKNNKALYFSRSHIPYVSDVHKIHIGIYGFRWETLKRIPSFGYSPLEQCERLEQLTWMYEGCQIWTKEIKDATHIDTKEDYETWLKT